MVGLMMTTKINELLARDDLDAYRNGQQAVSGAASVRDAVERSNILDGFTAEEAAEARAVLDALPPAIDAAILAALARGLRPRRPGPVRMARGCVH